MNRRAHLFLFAAGATVLAGAAAYFYGPDLGHNAPGHSVRAIASAAPLAPCTVCHGADGNSPNGAIPKLAGQDFDYLVAQLEGFADGTRPSEIMRPIAKALSQDDKLALADFYARQTIKAYAVADRGSSERGAEIFFRGTDDAQACSTCHAPGGGRSMMMGHRGMMGMMGTSGPVPKLSGQHAAYLRDQLDRYAAGTRHSPPMNNIAAALTAADREAVAAYLAAPR